MAAVRQSQKEILRARQGVALRMTDVVGLPASEGLRPGKGFHSTATAAAWKAASTPIEGLR